MQMNDGCIDSWVSNVGICVMWAALSGPSPLPTQLHLPFYCQAKCTHHLTLTESLYLAQVRHLQLPDTRNMYGSTTVLNRVYGYERKRLNATLREMLFRNAPSARR